jgi:hypothetical protein
LSYFVDGIPVPVWILHSPVEAKQRNFEAFILSIHRGPDFPNKNKIMFELYQQGGPLFMGLLTLILLSLISVFVIAFSKRRNEETLNRSIQWLKSIGTLGLVVGILGQLIGLFSAFSFLEKQESIATNILVGGLKVSLITTLYGILIYIIYLLSAMILKRLA